MDPTRPRPEDHPLVRELLAAYPGSASPTEAMRFAARRRLKKARAYGFAGPPFNPRILASLLGIKTRSDTLPAGLDAVLAPEPDGRLTIVWNETAPEKRANFSVAHEIGHTLFPSCAVEVQYRNQRGLNFEPDQFVERLCDIAAAELLMPLDDFKVDLASLGTTAAAVVALSERYLASQEAVALRMQALHSEPLAVAVVIAEEVAPGSLDIRALYSVPNRAMRSRWPGLESADDLRAPSTSGCWATLTGEARTRRGLEPWSVAGAPATLDVEALALDSDGAPRSLVLLRPPAVEA